MKNTICYIIIMLLSVSIYSQGGRDIKIEYQHSKRIPYNYISIEFQTLKNEYTVFVKTLQMNGKTGYEYSNTEKKILIDKHYFDSVYEKILKLDFKQIILSNENVVGSDGFDVSLVFGSSQNNITLNVWTPNYDSEKRGLSDLNDILKDIFILIDLIDYY